jgi:hypothetical protein
MDVKVVLLTGAASGIGLAAATGFTMLGAAPEAIETTGLFWYDRKPRRTRNTVGPDDETEEARRALWTHVNLLSGHS